MLIAILEDNADRIVAMKSWLDDRFRMYETMITDDPDELTHLLLAPCHLELEEHVRQAAG